MLQSTLEDLLSNTYKWLFIHNKFQIFTWSDHNYLSNIRVVNLEELTNKYFPSKSYDDKYINIVEFGYCFQCDPEFHEFLLNRPKPNIKHHRKRSPHYRYIR
jgi:hypothetical protein